MHQSLAILKEFFRYNYVIMVSYFFGLIHLYFDFDRFLGCRSLLRPLQPLSGIEGIAIHIANDTDYGLAAGVFTKDVDMATKTASRLNGGQVYVNSWFTGSIATPFGGYKQSGYSREKGQQAIKSYLQLKNVGIQL